MRIQWHQRRGGRRIRWHRLFARLLLDRGPAGLRVITEFELFRDPPRIDLLLLRRMSHRRGSRKARVLRRLWRMIPAVTAAELKTAAAPYARGDLFRLQAYASHYFADHVRQLRQPLRLGMVLMVPTLTPHLQLDLALLGWSLTSAGDGYVRIEGCPFRGVVVLLDDVAHAERDDLIGCIAHRRIRTTEGAEWLLLRGGVPEALAMAKIAGFRKSVVKRLTTKERLAGIPAKERVAGLPARELKKLMQSKEFIKVFQSLPAATRRRIAGTPVSSGR